MKLQNMLSISMDELIRMQYLDRATLPVALTPLHAGSPPQDVPAPASVRLPTPSAPPAPS